jgi:hypothetical protein
MFAERVAFRGMTPGRFWEANTPDEVIHDVLYRWFDAADVVEQVDSVEPGRIVNRDRVDYRLRVRNPDGLFAVEQRAYFDVDDDGRIVRMLAMCAGYQNYRADSVEPSELASSEPAPSATSAPPSEPRVAS